MSGFSHWDGFEMVGKPFGPFGNPVAYHHLLHYLMAVDGNFGAYPTLW